MIIDVSFITTFQEAESIKNYFDLCNFFKSFSEQFYNDQNIYYEEHYITPKIHGGTIGDRIYLPKWFHAKAHILRANNLKSSSKYKNYAIANIILGVNYSPRQLRNLKFLPEKKIWT